MNDPGQVLIVIPARGGSKRLPRKNVLPLVGKPLIFWTIEAAIQASVDARILVTSDDDEILEVAGQYIQNGVSVYKRPDELATDTASTVDVVRNACEFVTLHGFSPRTIILLQPTSPLRTSEDIALSYDHFCRNNTRDTVVSVCEVDHPTAWTGVLTETNKIDGIAFSNKRSQDYSKEYRLNGAIYIVDYNLMHVNDSLFTHDVYAYVMPKARSVDIDDEFDLKYAEYILKRGLL